MLLVGHLVLLSEKAVKTQSSCRQIPRRQSTSMVTLHVTVLNNHRYVTLVDIKHIYISFKSSFQGLWRPEEQATFCRLWCMML